MLQKGRVIVVWGSILHFFLIVNSIFFNAKLLLGWTYFDEMRKFGWYMFFEVLIWWKFNIKCQGIDFYYFEYQACIKNWVCCIFFSCEQYFLNFYWIYWICFDGMSIWVDNTWYWVKLLCVNYGWDLFWSVLEIIHIDLVVFW